MPSADRDLPGGGPAQVITLQTHPPLPSFSIPHRVPDPSTDISSFKLSIHRILTGQTTSSSSTKPLTFSEEVKEKAINGWKMQMLTLELRQRDDLEAEETNPASSTSSDDDQMKGFELQDHHECSLIEEGDMIVVRLKPGHELSELELPKLGPDHRYSAPAGSLTRAGTLSEPPPYSIIRPSEPSSFSSSVGAQPNANYHQHRYQDYRSAFRVVTADNVGSGRMRRSNGANNAVTGYTQPAGLGQGLNLLAPSSGAKGSGTKGKRRSSANATAGAGVAKASASPKLGNTATPPAITSATTSATGATTPSTNPSTAALAASTIDQPHIPSSPTSPRLELSGTSAPASAPAPARRTSSSIVTVQANRTTPVASPNLGHGRASSSGQFPSMPATALVIGPGVQGQVGRNPTSVNAPIGSMGGAEYEYGNAKGFVGFTGASVVETRAKPKRRVSKANSQDFTPDSSESNMPDASGSRWRPSNPSAAAADAAEKRVALARQFYPENSNIDVKRPAKERQSSSSRIVSKTELPSPPILPPIQNLAPFPEFDEATPKPRRERDLPPMPFLADAEASTSMVAVSAPTECKPPRLSFLRKFSATTQGSRGTDTSGGGAESPSQDTSRGLGFAFKQPLTTPVPLEDMDPAIKPALEVEQSQASGLSRAERRYMEVQKQLSVERERQAEAEKLRAEEARERLARKEKERERKENEAKKRAEEQKWEMWEEIRRRQQKDKGEIHKPLPPGIQRLYSGATNESSGSGKGKFAAQPGGQADPGSSSPHKDKHISVIAGGVSGFAAISSAAAATPTSGGTNGASASPSAPLAPTAPAAPAAPAAPSNGDGLPGQRIELGLERIVRLLTRLNDPHKSFPVIHVAGTNGKGSTIAYLDSLLRNALDIRTGTFVSPHLIERRDCCRISGDVVPKSIWRQAQSDVLFADQGLDISATADDDGQPLKSSPFELLTAQTFQAFSLMPENSKPEVLLIEVGLGGRLDATNVFDSSQVLASVICPIDRDHEAFLGSQLEGIAREKAGIVKPKGLCIIADQRLDDLSPVDQLALGPLENESKAVGPRAAGILDSIRNTCIARNARLVKAYVPWKLLSLPPTKQDSWGSAVEFTPRLGPTLFESKSGLNPRSTFVAHPNDPVLFSVPIRVERTRANLTGAVMAVQTLASVSKDEVEADRWDELRTRILWGLRDDTEANLRIRESINSVTWAGRCSWHNIDGTNVLVDGAHNESSAVALREYVENCLAARALSHPLTEGKGKSKRAAAQPQFEITYVFAFSEGKDYEAMVRALLANPSHLVLRQNVALTTFSPPEGMPWVRAVELQDSLATLKRVAKTVDAGELRTFESVNEAVKWAQAKSEARGPIVVAGSLYLVADMYRYLQSKGLWENL